MCLPPLILRPPEVIIHASSSAPTQSQSSNPHLSPFSLTRPLPPSSLSLPLSSIALSLSRFDLFPDLLVSSMKAKLPPAATE